MPPEGVKFISGKGTIGMKYAGTALIYSWMTALVLALLCFGSIVARPASADEKEIYLAIDSFTWKEFDEDGSRLLKETGPLVGFGFAYWRESDDHFILMPSAEVFGGQVDYDGQTQTGIPVSTDVGYFGMNFKFDIGRRFRPAQGFYLEPFGGLGYRFWFRDIRDSTTSTGTPVSGYTEGWSVWNARLGLRGGKEFSETSRLFVEAGMKLPLYNENTAYLSNVGLGSDVTFNPGKMVSYFAEAGVKINRFKGSLFYDGLRFSKSNTVQSGIYLYWQPKSMMDIYGLKLGVSF
jgi:hypothetical protein